MKKLLKRILLILKIRKYKKNIILGKNVVFGQNFSIVNNNINDFRIYIGDSAVLDCAIHLEKSGSEVYIGDSVYIGGNTKIICASSIKIDSNVTISFNVTVYDHNSHSLDPLLRRDDHQQLLRNIERKKNYLLNKNWDVVNIKPVYIGKDCWIGFNSIILKGVNIGARSIVGASSLLTKNCPEDSICTGVPAIINSRFKNAYSNS